MESDEKVVNLGLLDDEDGILDDGPLSTFVKKYPENCKWLKKADLAFRDGPFSVL